MVAPVAAAAAPSLMPSLIAAGGSLLGGLLGSSSSKKQAKKDRAMAQAQFDAQMDETIQRRVKDARSAGLHPLFALGASPGASPTAHISGQSDSGSFMAEGLGTAARSIAKGMDPLQKAQIIKLSSAAKLDDAQAQVLRDKERNGTQTGNSGDVRTFAATPPWVPTTNQIPSRDAFKPHLTAGNPSAFTKAVVGRNRDGSPRMQTVVAGDEMTEQIAPMSMIMGYLSDQGWFDQGPAKPKRGQTTQGYWDIKRVMRSIGDMFK